jgi:hypothetical protein
MNAIGPSAGSPTGAPAPDGGGLHEEVVRMLVIDERVPLVGLADLEDVAVALLADRGGIEAQHQVQRQLALADVLPRHPHPPVRRLDLALAARAALVVEHHEEVRVLHERPARRRHGVPGVRILREGLTGGQQARQKDPCPRSHVTMMSCTT